MPGLTVVRPGWSAPWDQAAPRRHLCHAGQPHHSCHYRGQFVAKPGHVSHGRLHGLQRKRATARSAAHDTGSTRATARSWLCDFTRRCKPILATKAIYFTRKDMQDRVKSPESVQDELDVTRRREAVLQGMQNKTAAPDTTETTQSQPHDPEHPDQRGPEFDAQEAPVSPDNANSCAPDGAPPVDDTDQDERAFRTTPARENRKWQDRGPRRGARPQVPSAARRKPASDRNVARIRKAGCPQTRSALPSWPRRRPVSCRFW